MRMIRLVSVLCILAAGACESRAAQERTSSASPEPAQSRTAAADGTIRLFWQGLKQISADTNAASFLGVWNLPETRRIEEQTLDKLASAPWRLLHRAPNTNAAALLRPLLDDVVQQPSFLEIRRTTNQMGELAFAIQLDKERAALWQTNLAAVVKSLAGVTVTPSSAASKGWSLKQSHAPNFIALARLDDWVVVRVGWEQNAAFDAFVSRLHHHDVPFAVRSTNDWFEADSDLQFLARTFLSPSNLPPNLPKFSIAITGDGQNVRTRGNFTFPRPLSLTLPPWNLPTNLIDGNLDSFTAARGFRPELELLKIWRHLQIGPPPDQVCFWALSGFPMQTFFVAPWADASNEVARLANHVTRGELSWSSTNGIAGFKTSTNFNGLEWTGLPYMAPFLLSVATNHSEYVLGGFFPLAPVIQPLPPPLLHQLFDHAGRVYYDWELTGPRIKEWLYLGQLLRMVSLQAQLPPDSAAVKWLEALESKLGNCATEITRTGPAQLSFTRKSAIGFTAIELHLLADWLESPQFPRGLYSLLTPPDSAAPGNQSR